MGHLDGILRGVAGGHAVLANGDGRLVGVVPLPGSDCPLDDSPVVAERGRWLTDQMRRADVSDKGLADKMGVSTTAVRNWRLGRRRITEERERQIDAALSLPARFELRLED